MSRDEPTKAVASQAMSCTMCGADTDATADDFVAMADKVRGWRRRAMFVATLCAEWKCDACLTIVEREAAEAAKGGRP